MDYYLLRNGEQSGPHSESELRGRLTRGDASPEDYLWHEGAEDWKPLGALLPRPTGEPATARQRAFLAFMGVTAPPDATRPEAAVLVNDAMEKDPSRLARWNEERLQLHPDIFAEEIQARKEGRAQRYFEVCQREGTAWFTKVAKAHCQVLVGHLDVHSPKWDAIEADAATRYFFPALAQKFPQLLTTEGRAHFQHSESARSTPDAPKHSSPASAPARGSSAGRKIFALVRGAIYGGVILAALWFSRAHLERLLPPLAPIVAEAPRPAADAAPPAADTTPAAVLDSVPAPVASVGDQ